MSTFLAFLLFCVFATGLSAAEAPPTNSAPAPEAAATNQPTAAAIAAAPTDTNALATTNAAPEPITSENSASGLRMNFKNAPLNLVLDYLVDAAGFIVNNRPDVSGTVSISSKGPVTKEEAVDLLNSQLKKNGYSITRNGRILNIISLDTAKTANTRIQSGNNPDDVEESDEVVTQIIPVRYANVSQLTANLEVLLPTSATLSANESANTLILVATKTDVKRMLKIIDALDTSIASVSSIRVIPLRYADAKDTASLITQLFAPQNTTQQGGGGRGNLFNMFGGGGFGGRFGGFGGGGGGNTGGGGRSTTGGGAAATHVVAVADDRSNSLIVSAPADLLTTIAEMVEKVDQPVTDATEIRVFHLTNAVPSDVANQLSQLFPDDTGNNNNANTPAPPFFFRGGFGRGGFGAQNNNNAAGTSDRMKKMGRVLAVPDPRTSSLIVTASKTMMPEIENMITTLDADVGKRQVVGSYELQNADVQDVNQILQDLFNKGNVRMNNNNNSRSMLGTGNPLSQRQTQNQQTSGSGSSSFGTTGRSGGASGIGSGF